MGNQELLVLVIPMDNKKCFYRQLTLFSPNDVKTWLTKISSLWTPLWSFAIKVTCFHEQTWYANIFANFTCLQEPRG